MQTYGAAVEALADGTRRTVFERLRGGPRSVGQLAEGLPVTRPAVSQHLRVLREAGLVRARAEGTRRIYELDPRGLEPVRRYFEELWHDALSAFAEEAERKPSRERGS